jgi:hypothetical protein
MSEGIEGTGRQTHAVFLHDSIEINRPVSRVWSSLCTDGSWLAPLAARATDSGETMLRVGPGRGALSSREVLIRLGQCSYQQGVSYIAIRWEASRLSRLFPILDGTLELSSKDETHSRLAIKASYRPPFESVGRLIDAALLHKVAEATVHSFLSQLAATLESAEECGQAS